MSKRCQARRPDGTPCPNEAEAGSPYCAFHQPDRLEQQTREFTEQFTRELMRQGTIALIRRRLKDMGLAAGLLAILALLVGVALQFFPEVDASIGDALFCGGVLKLPIALLAVFLLRERPLIGLVVPLFYVPLDLLGAFYYQQTNSLTPALWAYYQLYWQVGPAIVVGLLSLLLAVGGYLLGKLFRR